MTLKNDYFESDEFREILDIYVESQRSGVDPYLDVDDFCDVADYYMNEEDPDAALSCIDRGLGLFPDEQQLLLIKSGVYIYTHRFEEAEGIVARCDEANSEVLYQRAQLEYALHGNVGRAEEMFADWLALEREYAVREEEFEQQREEYIRDSYIHVITSLIELAPNGDYDEELVKRWIELYLASFSPLGGYDSDLVLADTVRCECLYDMIVKVYGSLLDSDPYMKHGWTVLAAAQFTANNIDDALESVEFALAIDPDDTDSILTKAHCLMSKQAYKEAAGLLLRYIGMTGDESQHLPLATCYVECDDFEQAASSLCTAELYFRRFADEKEYYASACYEIADLYFRMNDLEVARLYIDNAMRLVPEEKEYMFLSATLMLAEDRVEESLLTFARFIDGQEDIIGTVLRIVPRLIAFNLDNLALRMLNSLEDMKRKGYSVERVYPCKALIYIRKENAKSAAKYIKLGLQYCREMTEWMLAEYIPEGMTIDMYCDTLQYLIR